MRLRRLLRRLLLKPPPARWQWQAREGEPDEFGLAGHRYRHEHVRGMTVAEMNEFGRIAVASFDHEEMADFYERADALIREQEG